MGSLNKTSLDVWTEFLKKQENRKVSERIMELDGLHNLTLVQQEEMEVLLKLEAKFLGNTELVVQEGKKYLRKFNYYKNKLSHDERLLAIYYERTSNVLNCIDNVTEEDIDNVYIAMMEEDMDVEGHKNLNSVYEEMKAETTEDNKECDNPDCVYCRPISSDEYDEAYAELDTDGFFQEGMNEEDKLIQLMVRVHRLEDELTLYRMEDSDFFNHFFEEDDDLDDLL